MDVAARKKFVHGFSREPVLGPDGKPRIIFMRDLTPVDRAILRALARYRTLSAHHLAALAGCHYIHACERIKLLKSPGNDYIKILDIQQQHQNRFRTSPHYVELAPAGFAAVLQLENIRVPKPSKDIEWLEHKTMECESMSDFQIGTIRHPEVLRHIWRDEILADPRTPEATRDANSPETMFLPGRTEDGKRKRIRPDGTLFALEFLQEGGFCFFPGIEAETGKNPEDRVVKKLENYLTILSERIYATHFNARTFFIPFVFATDYKLERAMEQWEEISRKHKQHRANVLFKKTVTFETGRPLGTGAMIETDWQRVGMPPVNFLSHTF